MTPIIKPGASKFLAVSLVPLNLADVDTATIVIKNKADRTTTPLLSLSYPSTAVSLSDDSKSLIIALSSTQTDGLPNNSRLWMDIKPVLTDGKIASVGLIEMQTSTTLFAESDV